jgi:hypothetical protein
VRAGDELRVLVAAEVDYRFVESAEASAWIGKQNPIRFEDLQHKVGAGTIDNPGFRSIAGKIAGND